MLACVFSFANVYVCHRTLCSPEAPPCSGTSADACRGTWRGLWTHVWKWAKSWAAASWRWGKRKEKEDLSTILFLKSIFLEKSEHRPLKSLENTLKWRLIVVTQTFLYTKLIFYVVVGVIVISHIVLLTVQICIKKAFSPRRSSQQVVFCPDTLSMTLFVCSPSPLMCKSSLITCRGTLSGSEDQCWHLLWVSKQYFQLL